MALKKNPGELEVHYDSVHKAAQVFKGEKPFQKEKKILTTFSIEPSIQRKNWKRCFMIWDSVGPAVSDLHSKSSVKNMPRNDLYDFRWSFTAKLYENDINNSINKM